MHFLTFLNSTIGGAEPKAQTRPTVPGAASPRSPLPPGGALGTSTTENVLGQYLLKFPGHP